MLKVQKGLLIVFVIGLFVVACGGPSSKEFEIKGDEAKLTKNMGSIIVLSQLVYDIADNVKESMDTVLKDDKLKNLKTIILRHEVKSGENDHRGVCTLRIPVAEWQQIPEKNREDMYWISHNLEGWKQMIDYELVMEIRKMNKK
jgi:hypothetical protein